MESHGGRLGLDDAEHAAAIQQADPVPNVTVGHLDLMAGDDYFVLTEARANGPPVSGRDMADSAPDTADSRRQWATAADRMLDRIEAAIGRKETR